MLKCCLNTRTLITSSLNYLLYKTHTYAMFELSIERMEMNQDTQNLFGVNGLFVQLIWYISVDIQVLVILIEIGRTNKTGRFYITHWSQYLKLPDNIWKKKKRPASMYEHEK